MFTHTTAKAIQTHRYAAEAVTRPARRAWVTRIAGMVRRRVTTRPVAERSPAQTWNIDHGVAGEAVR